MRIALAGNPNSGKTTMYNALTGKNEKVGNWAGVTVSTKESLIKKSFYDGNEEFIICDLPGAYSMSPYTSEESITSSFVKEQNLDAIINIVDGTNLSRSLFFTTQLLDLKIPVVVALNKTDINIKKETKIDVNKLSKLLKCPVIETCSINNDHNDLKILIDTVLNHKNNIQEAPFKGSVGQTNDKATVEKLDRERFDFVNDIVKKTETRKVFTNKRNNQDFIDSILTNKISGTIIFALVMYGVFYISQTWLGPYIADNILVPLIEQFQGYVSGLMEGTSPLLQSIVLEGIIGGVGAVLGFLPLVMVMYFLIALLEDLGYMARVSVIMDPIFKKVGLSGKSIIPMIIGTGCAIPGIMACRTIKNERERRTTAMLTPFMPCGAKIPVIALIVGVFFKDSSLISTLMYFMGIALIFFGAYVVLKITGHKYRKSFFIIELPEYKIPSVKEAFRSMLLRGKAYIVKAGTIILVSNTLITVMQSFTWNFQLVEEGMEHTSILASIASPIAFILVPLGFGVWQLAAAAVSGFIAKENVVGTVATVYGLQAFINVDELVLMHGANEVATVMGLTQAAALAYLMFNLFTPPCFAAIGAMNSEMQDKKWLFGGIGLQFSFAYILSFIVYQGGTLLQEGHLGSGFVLGLAISVIIILIIASLILNTNRELKKVK